MAKVKGPLLSLGASGQIGKAQVYANWRGVPYARQHVVPSNPNTLAQQSTRNTFAALDELFKRSGPIAREPWVAEAQRRPVTDRNMYIKANLPPLRGAADMSGFVGSNGAKGGLPPSAVVAADSTTPNAIDVTVTSPAAPTGWTLFAVQAVAVRDRDPALTPTEFVHEIEDTTPVTAGDTVLTIPDCVVAGVYYVAAWTKWQKPDGSFAYGASLTDGPVTIA